MATIALNPSRARALALPAMPAGIAGSFMILAGVIRQLHPALDPDLNSHLRTGQLILATRAIPTSDPFSHTLAGTPWIDFEWLWELGLAALYSGAGVIGLVAANALLTGVIYGLVYGTLRLRNVPPICAALGVGLAVINLVGYDDVRPGVSGALFSAAFICILELARARQNWRWLILLAAIQALWVNCHASFVLGPALCGLYGLAAIWDRLSGENEQSLRRLLLGWGALCASVVVESLANTIGFGLIQFSLGASRLSSNHNHIGEWLAPNFHELWAAPLLLTVVLSVALPVLLRRAQPSIRESLLLITGTSGALFTGQFVTLYAVAAAPVLASILWRAIDRPLGIRLNLAHAGLFGLILLLLGAQSAASLTPSAYQAAFAHHYPVDAVAYIERNDLQGPIWNEFNWGAYLIGALPRLPVFIDGRTEMFRSFFDEYFAVSTGEVAPDELMERHHINLVLIPPQSALATVLRAGGRWDEVYGDDVVAVFVRPGGSRIAPTIS